MSGLFGAPSASANANANQAQGDTSKDVEVKDPPEDSVSDLSFSPQSEHLAVSSWDKKVRIYEIDGLGNSAGKAMFEHEGPVLSCAWSSVCLSTLPPKQLCFHHKHWNNPKLTHAPRMVPKSSAPAPTKPPACSTSIQARPPK